jgi:hypothetical protein
VTLDQVLDFLNRGGMLAILLLIVLGGHRRWYVWGWLYEEKVKESDEWKERAWRSANTTDKALDVAKKTVP